MINGCIKKQMYKNVLKIKKRGLYQEKLRGSVGKCKELSEPYEMP